MKSTKTLVIRIAATVEKHLKHAHGMSTAAIKAWFQAALEVKKARDNKNLGEGRVKQLAEALRRDPKTIYAWAKVPDVFSKRDIGKWLTRDVQGLLSRSHFVEAAQLGSAAERNKFLTSVIEKVEGDDNVTARSARTTSSSPDLPRTAPALLDSTLRQVRTYGDAFKGRMATTMADVRRARGMMAAGDAELAEQTLAGIQTVINEMGAELNNVGKAVAQEMAAIRGEMQPGPADAAVSSAKALPAHKAA